MGKRDDRKKKPKARRLDLRAEGGQKRVSHNLWGDICWSTPPKGTSEKRKGARIKRQAERLAAKRGS